MYYVITEDNENPTDGFATVDTVGEFYDLESTMKCAHEVAAELPSYMLIFVEDSDENQYEHISGTKDFSEYE